MKTIALEYSESNFWLLVGEACNGAVPAIREANLRGEGPFLWYAKGALRLAVDSPGSDWQLASGERVRVATLEQLPAWIGERARRLPLF